MSKIEKSMELWKQALELMPRGSQTMSKCPDQFNYGVSPIYLERGDGCWVQSVDGEWYIDYPCALGPVIFGYNHQRTNDAVKAQLNKGITFSLMHPVEVELAKLLVEVIPCAEQVRYAKNGTDATLAAVRIAKSYSGKPVIVKPEGHYHGWGDWHAASTTRDYGVPKVLKDYVRTFKYNDLESLEKQLMEADVAAVIMEPVSLEAPQPGFLQGVRELCTRYSTILIFDEMITGFRWALGGAQEYYGVTPDLATFGKAVANGMPLSIIAGKKEYMQEFNHIFFSMTFGGEACSIAAAIETIKEMKEIGPKMFDHIWEQGNRLASAFNSRAAELKIDAKMIGEAPRHNVQFNTSDPSGCKDLFQQEMVKHNILMGTQIYTTWAHKTSEVAKTIVVMNEALETIKKALDDNNIDKYLESERSASIFKKEISGD